MRFTLRLAFISISLLLLLSCAYKETTISGPNHAYARFSGNLHDAIVVVDGSFEFELNKFAESQKDVRFEMKPGKRNIVIRRYNKTIVNREMLFTAGIVTEITVP